MSITPDTLRPETLAELEANLEQMKTANYFLRVAVDQVPEAVLIVEADSGSPQGPRVLFSNAAAAVLVGVEPEKGLRGMNLADLAAGDMDAAVLMQSLRESVTNGGSHECECRVQNLYGREPLMCRWRARAVFNSQRKLLNHTLMITPKPALSAAAARTAPLNGGNLDAQSELLKQANLALLARGIAHDVNNLLGIPFMALSEMLQDAALPPRSKDTLTQIYQSLDLARQFTSRVLSACKDQPGTVKPADIAAIIQSTVKVAGAGANVELRVRAAGDLHRPVIDGVRLAQVLQNLILNGIQAMPTGGYMDIEAANTEFAEGQDEQLKAGRYVRIIVRDRGCGIPPENLARLFREPFTTKPGGNGIGLTTCRHYIKSEQGDIRVSSRPGVGTEFTVYLPVRDTPPETPPDGTDAAAPPQPATPRPGVPGEGHVLIVDDEDALRAFARQSLVKNGYQVSETDNGQDAVRLYQSLRRSGRTPDVVLMDLTLRGGMNGVETAGEILRFDPDARIVVCSGSVNQDVQNIFLEKGFLAALPKPYDIAELTRTVSDVITMMSRH